ncbi:hypothetical protein BT96DRAFT_611729 [Gymnopus androsaceus JB14]|uniref:Uncharacterized protein n=1 Tax=Gymnopus androsaceus JB14 TaxID=1447944 RepID=A0A6A4GIF0_9AGAR|nr:hypothetical protein BT96DRAFT_611729 [Gymnopus androsaceus JB14]
MLSDIRNRGKSLERDTSPGRFFVANEINTLVHVLATYDFRFEKDGIMPESRWFSQRIVLDGNAFVSGTCMPGGCNLVY